MCHLTGLRAPLRSGDPPGQGSGQDEDGLCDPRRAYLDAALVGGVEKRVIEIVDWSPDWPVRYDHERSRIARALGVGALRIEHIGSTAVPGLGAKPVIDVLVAVADPDDEQSFGPALTDAGYQLRVREPGHRMFRTTGRDVHVHIWASGSLDERRQLLFRDWLRRSAADARRYEDTKRRLASRDWPDMNLYAEAKTAVVCEIMERAEAWAAGGEWTL